MSPFHLPTVTLIKFEHQQLANVEAASANKLALQLLSMLTTFPSRLPSTLMLPLFTLCYLSSFIVYSSHMGLLHLFLGLHILLPISHSLSLSFGLCPSNMASRSFNFVLSSAMHSIGIECLALPPTRVRPPPSPRLPAPRHLASPWTPAALYQQFSTCFNYSDPVFKKQGGMSPDGDP